MLKDNLIFLGKSNDLEVNILPNMMNRHGLIAGASGTGKTVTLKVIAESLSELGVPVFMADVKGDLSGCLNQGDLSAIQERLDSMGVKDFNTRSFPVRFYDVYRKKGLPIRAVLQDMDTVLLAQILDLTDAQEGILQIIFKAASDMDLDIIDLKDLQAMTQYVSEHSVELSSKYGNVSKQSVNSIQRKLLELEQQGGTNLFGMPGLNITDLCDVNHGEGVINILECEELFRHPMLYSTFLLWLLDELYTNLPEVGDLDKPKIVFFFDEAHVLFEHCSSALLDKIIQTVKLIRSKGVSIFFCTQSPNDIPDEVLAQLSHKIQHALRAYTPSELKAVKTAAQSFRANPAFNTEDVITSMKTGHALVSVLDSEGAPTIVQETKILPPKSSMSAAGDADIDKCVKSDYLYTKYFNDVDPESAYEQMESITKLEQEAKAAEKEKALQEKIEEKKRLKEATQSKKTEDRLKRKVVNKLENEALNYGIRSAKKLLKGFFK